MSSEKSGAFAAFLLAQVGAHAAKRFAEHLEPLDLTPPQAGILRRLANSAGISQRDLAGRLGLHPSRLVAILDEMEAADLVVRQPHPEDRRLYSLHLTEKGKERMVELGRVARQHNESLCAGLSSDERTQRTALLQKVADQQGLTRGVHPGYSTLGKPGPRPPATDH